MGQISQDNRTSCSFVSVQTGNLTCRVMSTFKSQWQWYKQMGRAERTWRATRPTQSLVQVKKILGPLCLCEGSTCSTSAMNYVLRLQITITCLLMWDHWYITTDMDSLFVTQEDNWRGTGRTCFINAGLLIFKRRKKAEWKGSNKRREAELTLSPPVTSKKCKK